MKIKKIKYTKKLAKKAGFVIWDDCDWKPEGSWVDWSCDYDEELYKFEQLVREDERKKFKE